MITQFKIFETINEGKLKVGDYVVIDIDTFGSPLRLTILDDNICKIMEISLNGIDIRISCKTFSWWITKSEIVAFSENKEELEPILSTKKYNL